MSYYDVPITGIDLFLQLGTDMKQHFSQVSLFNTRLASCLNQRSVSSSCGGGGSACASPLASANASSSGITTLNMVLDDDSRGLALLVRTRSAAGVVALLRPPCLSDLHASVNQSNLPDDLPSACSQMGLECTDSATHLCHSTLMTPFTHCFTHTSPDEPQVR